MGSSSDGSSATERRDPKDRPPGRSSRGILGRLFPRLATEEAAVATAAGAPAVAAGPVLPGLANLRKLRVDDVAIPKASIVAVPLDTGREALVEVFREHGFSRLPVYKGTLDHPQGFVLMKDFALQHGFGATGRFSMRKLLRPLIYVPPSMPAAVLLQKMQRERSHMALVIDEYGGVDGLVTIEDLIETVIGQIDDEHDDVEAALWKEEKPGVFLAQATAPLDEIEAAIGVALRTGEDDGEIDTLGGLVFLRTGRVPGRGEIVPHESGVQFEVLDADPRRIKRLRLRLPGAIPPPAAPSEPPTYGA
jgi:magnesium and cobalt transporter